MGCDIHAYIEYKSEYGNLWRGFGGRINPGRNYYIFEAFAGVRGEIGNSVAEPRGFPEDAAYSSKDDNYLYITEDGKGDGCTTLEIAKSYAKHGSYIVNDVGGLPFRVSNPDWHTHSWLTVAEIEKAMELAYNGYCSWLKEEKLSNDKLLSKHKMSAEEKSRLESIYSIPEQCKWEPEYLAVIAAMKQLGACGCKTRLVFWFDN